MSYPGQTRDRAYIHASAGGSRRGDGRTKPGARCVTAATQWITFAAALTRLPWLSKDEMPIMSSSPGIIKAMNFSKATTMPSNDFKVCRQHGKQENVATTYAGDGAAARRLLNNRC